MQVDLSKKYRTRVGREVMLYHIHHDTPMTYKVHGAVKNPTEQVWVPNSWTLSGEALKNHKQAADLVEVSPYEDFKINEEVILPCGKHAHFAGIDPATGYPRVFRHGRTSWTTKDGFEVCFFVHRAEK